MSESKPPQNSQQQKLRSIKAKLAQIGVNNHQLPDLLLKEIVERVAAAKLRTAKQVAKAQTKADRIVAQAEQSAFAQVMKPQHVCRVLGRIIAAASPKPEAAEDAVPSKTRTPKPSTEEATS